MGAIIGLVIGYILGTRAGDKGNLELQQSWRTITTSQGFRDMLGGLFALVGEFLHRSRGILAQRLQVPEVAEGDQRALSQAA
jgi:hypothetical protein